MLPQVLSPQLKNTHERRDAAPIPRTISSHFTLDGSFKELTLDELRSFSACQRVSEPGKSPSRSQADLESRSLDRIPEERTGIPPGRLFAELFSAILRDAVSNLESHGVAKHSRSCSPHYGAYHTLSHTLGDGCEWQASRYVRRDPLSRRTGDSRAARLDSGGALVLEFDRTTALPHESDARSALPELRLPSPTPAKEKSPFATECAI